MPAKLKAEYSIDHTGVSALALMLSGPELKAMLEDMAHGLVELSEELSGSAPSDRLRIAGALEALCETQSKHLSWKAIE